MADTTIITDNKRHFKANTVFIISGISFGAVSYAYAGSIIGTTLGQPSFYAYTHLATNPDEAALLGAVTSLFYAGGVFGCLFNSWMADRYVVMAVMGELSQIDHLVRRYGRKWTVVAGSLILMVATACLAGSINIGMFIAFRFFAGFG